MSNEFEDVIKDIQRRIDEDEEALYSKKVVEEYRNPQHIGFFKNPDAHGKLKGSCGDTMQFDLKIQNDRIVDARFFTDGCGPSIACGSMLSKMIIGKLLDEVVTISSDDVYNALDGLPKENEHCAVLAVNTLALCIASYHNKKE